MKVDYIIVGLGLAGIAFAEELIQAKKSFLVFEDASQTSSIVAGGVYNPVILKRYTPVWNAKEQLELAMPFYERLELKLKKSFDEKFTTKKVFKSIEDQNNWFTAIDKPKLTPFLDPILDGGSYKGVIANYKFGNVKETGKLDTKLFVETYRSFLKEKGNIRFETFVHDAIEIKNTSVNYKDITAQKIVFAEGYGVHKNPFFNYLPLHGTKGELLTIHAPELEIDFLLKSTVFVLPIGNYYFRIGATFNHSDKTSLPTEAGKKELVEKLEKVINVPYTIVDQVAGVRPTVSDRKPLVGIHHKYPNLAILNGLGTRGVMIAPSMAKQLFNHLENSGAIYPEADIKRFFQK